MSLPSALAAFLQNHDSIGPLISGVVSDRNFELQDKFLTTAPYTCIAVSPMPLLITPYIGTSSSGNVRKTGQIEVRIISKASAVAASDLMELLVGDGGILWTTKSLPDNGVNLAWNMTRCFPVPDIDQETKTWLQILTIDYRS